MVNPPDPSHATDQKVWVGYVSKIAFGVFLTAAFGLFGYVGVLKWLFGKNLESFDRYVIFFIIIGFVLFVLSHVRERIDKDGVVGAIARYVVAGVTILLALIFVTWVGAFVGRDIGLFPPVRTESVSYMLHPAGRADTKGISYDPKTTLRRTDGRAMSYHVVQDSSHMGKLDGIYVEFGPGEDEIEAQLTLPYEVEGKAHRVRLSRTTKTFDFLD